MSTSRGSACEHLAAARRARARSRSRRATAAPSARTSLEDDARVQVAEAAELQRVVGRLEADDELRLVDEAGRARRRPAAGSRPGRAPRAGRRAARGRRRARSRPPSARARSSPRARPSCRSRRARRPSRPRSVPGRFPCAGTVSVCPASRTSGLPVALGVEQRSRRPRSAVSSGTRGVDVRAHIAASLPRLRGDVDELERPLRECVTRARAGIIESR